MTISEPDKDLIARIRSAFLRGSFSTAVHDCARDRHQQAIEQLCAGCRVVNQTDFNYSTCNNYDIEVPESSRNRPVIVSFKISCILDAYSIHITEYGSDRREGNVIEEEACPEAAPLIQLLRDFCEEKEIQEITSTQHNIIVEDVTLELSEVATIGKCLFDDFE